jgi:hypothetical protein
MLESIKKALASIRTQPKLCLITTLLTYVGAALVGYGVTIFVGFGEGLRVGWNDAMYGMRHGALNISTIP